MILMGKIDFESKMLALFATSPLCLLTKYNNFLWVGWFSAKNLTMYIHFLFLLWNLTSHITCSCCVDETASSILLHHPRSRSEPQVRLRVFFQKFRYLENQYEREKLKMEIDIKKIAMLEGIEKYVILSLKTLWINSTFRLTNAVRLVVIQI